MAVSPTRRTLICAAVAGALPLRAWAEALDAGAPHTPLAFEVWRRGDRIGTHRVDFQGGDEDFTVHIDAEMLVKFGPIPVFNYHHQAQETWRGGQFQRLQSHTTTNGSTQTLSAERSDAGVAITGRRTLAAVANAHPLTHWNPAVLEGPLFNPQTGAMIHDRVARAPDAGVKLADGRSVAATRYSLTGQTEIVDWYDAKGVWTALRAKAPDGSFIEYRKLA